MSIFILDFLRTAHVSFEPFNLDGLPDFLPYALFPVTVVLYDLLSQRIMKNQTFGKRACSLKVVKRDGSTPGLGSYLLYEILRFISPIFVLVGSYIGVVLLTDEFKYSLLPGLVTVVSVVILLLILKIKLRKDRRSGKMVTVSACRTKTDEPLKPDTTNKPEPPDALIGNIEKVSQNAKGIYFIFSGLLTFCTLTIAGSSDRQIVLNGPTNLPIINVEVSMDGFFILAPLLAIFFFTYFQIYLERLRNLLSDLRTNYQKINEAQRIYPWMLNFADEPDARLATRFIVNFSIWWSLPVVLMFLALWYLKKHEPILGGMVGLAPLLGTIVVLSFWTKSPGKDFTFNRPQITLLGIVLLFEIYFFGVFMPRALRGERLIGTWPAVDVSHENLMSKLDDKQQS